MRDLREFADNATELVSDMGGVECVGYNTKDLVVYFSDNIVQSDVLKRLSSIPVSIHFQKIGKLNLKDG